MNSPIIDSSVKTMDPAAKEQWYDKQPKEFTKSQRATTTILIGGMTDTHDSFLASALSSLGYNFRAIPTPDNAAFQLGKEFGNRGQCNPTYFTSGNIVKFLRELEAEGHSKKDIIEKFLFLTPSSCGPCRFDSYSTEYRKALRDSGFEGFRIINWQQTGSIKGEGEESGLNVNPKFLLRGARAAMTADILQAIGYRLRPYEIEKGAVNEAQDKCRELLNAAFKANKGIGKTMKQCKKLMAAVKLDKTLVKPKVSIIGEFWAMTTEGEGNYHLKSFLEGEGAEVEVQPFTAWILYLIWVRAYNLKERMDLKGVDMIASEGGSQFSLKGINIRKTNLALLFTDKGMRKAFSYWSKKMGLENYHLADMNELAEISHKYYDSNLRGGEGHMEVAKLIMNVSHKKANMTISVKPFGCMPSSGVSDGVQSKIVEEYPQAIFLPIETSGDGAINVYSRVQMQLFKAKEAAEKEFETAKKSGAKHNKKPNDKPLSYAKKGYACSAANYVG